MTPLAYRMLADAMLITHFLFVAFVILGFVAILAGICCGWPWARSKAFRLIHLLAIGFVVVQAWAGQACPLTVWENAFRDKAGDAPYSGAFLQYWLHKVLYFQAPTWVFTTAYTVFGVLVLLVWIFGDRAADYIAANKNSCERPI